MKHLSLLVLCVSVLTPHASCSASGLINSTIHPSDITPRGQLSSRSPPLSWTSSRELIARVDSPTKKALAVEFAKRTAFTGIVGVSILGAVGDCQELYQDSKNATAGTGVVCVVGTLGTLIALATESVKTATFFIEIAKVSAQAVVQYSVNTVLNKYIGGDFGMVGPFFRTRAGLPTKRDHAHLYKRVEEHFTSTIGVEVRHIGFWDGSVHLDPRSEVVRHEQSQEGTIPAFGLTLYGQDVHFAYTGQTADGHSTFKIGQGPGPETEENKRRLKARDTYVPLFNNYYFDQGGFDVIADANTDGSAADTLPEVSSNDFDYASIYTQLLCILGLNDPRALNADAPPSQLDSIGLWFQMYDNAYRGTIAAGAVAPFSADQESVIQWMQPEGGLAIDPFCSF